MDLVGEFLLLFDFRAIPYRAQGFLSVFSPSLLAVLRGPSMGFKPGLASCKARILISVLSSLLTVSFGGPYSLILGVFPSCLL